MQRVLAVFFSIEIIGMVVGLSLSLPRITYDDLCLVIFAPRTLIIYAYVIFSRPPLSILTDRLYIYRGAAILFQAILFVITLYKFLLAIRSGWGDVPLIVLLTRDGTWAFFLLFCAFFSCLSYFQPDAKIIYKLLMGDTSCCTHCITLLMLVSYLGEPFFRVHNDSVIYHTPDGS